MSYPAVVVALVIVAVAAWALSRDTDAFSAELFGPEATSPRAKRAADAASPDATLSSPADARRAAWRAGVVDATNTMQSAWDSLLAAAPSYGIYQMRIDAIVAMSETGSKSALASATRGTSPAFLLSRGAQPLRVAFNGTWLALQSAIAAADR